MTDDPLKEDFDQDPVLWASQTLSDTEPASPTVESTIGRLASEAVDAFHAYLRSMKEERFVQAGHDLELLARTLENLRDLTDQHLR